MFKVWTASDSDPEALARRLQAHLNEFAADVLDIGYSVAERHFVLAVYRQLEASEDDHVEAAVDIAEEIVGDAQE
jgi:hypothetical protein